MTCSSVDLKAYVLGELAAPERREVEAHAGACAVCREELARLRLTQDALLALREEEVPRRIAFVSDKVFEPSWWRSLWWSAPKLGFVSASLVAAALLVHAFVRPAPVVVSTAPDMAQIEARIQKEVAARVQVAVEKAVAEAGARQAQKTQEVLAAAERRFELDRRAERAAFANNLRMLEQQNVALYRAASGVRVQ